MLNLGNDQLIAGWREPDEQKKTGIAIFVPTGDISKWNKFLVDDNGIACFHAIAHLLLHFPDSSGDVRGDVCRHEQSLRSGQRLLAEIVDPQQAIETIAISVCSKIARLTVARARKYPNHLN